MNAHAKIKAAAPAKRQGERPDDVLDDARDLLKTVRLALMSEWFDEEERISLAVVVGNALRQLDRIHIALGAGVESSWDPATPKGKWLIPEFAPEAAR